MFTRKFGYARVVVLLSMACIGWFSPASPAVAEHYTMWKWLGIPQAYNKIYDASINRNGNRPGLERKPPLKGIGDPANLEAPDLKIKTAAAIKQQEDLKKQKIKAIKYLATVGCGCYKGVKEAFIDALVDCTEEVRYEAALALIESARNKCKTCQHSCCCDPDMMKVLYERAYERDAEGCFIEPSQRVREACMVALRACCATHRAPPGAYPIGPPSELIPSEVPALPQPETTSVEPVSPEAVVDRLAPGAVDVQAAPTVAEQTVVAPAVEAEPSGQPAIPHVTTVETNAPKLTFARPAPLPAAKATTGTTPAIETKVQKAPVKKSTATNTIQRRPQPEQSTGLIPYLFAPAPKQPMRQTVKPASQPGVRQSPQIVHPTPKPAPSEMKPEIHTIDHQEPIRHPAVQSPATRQPRRSIPHPEVYISDR